MRTTTPDNVNTTSESEASHERVMRDLHTLLLETDVREGKLVCGNCRHEYRIKEGIANFLLPSHLGEPTPSTFALLLHSRGSAGKHMLLLQLVWSVYAEVIGSLIIV